MLLLSLLIPPLIISLPQTLSKLSHLPSGIKSAVEHFRGTTPPPEYPPPSDGPPEYQPEPLEDLQLEFQRAPYLPLLMSGKEAWTTLEMDPGNAWGEGNKEHVWFFWFSGVELDLYREIAAPLEGGEWPPIVVDEDGEFEWRRRRLEVGMFQGSKNDQVYRVWRYTLSSSLVPLTENRNFDRKLPSRSAGDNMKNNGSSSKLTLWHRQLQPTSNLQALTQFCSRARHLLHPLHHTLTLRL